MNPTFSRATLPALLLALILARPHASAGVIEVGPAKSVRTLDAAVTVAKVGDEIVLDRGVEHVTDGVEITTDAIEIRSADGPGDRAVIRTVSTKQYPVAIEHRAEGLMLRDLTFTAGSPNVTCVRARGRRLTLDDVEPAGDNVWRWVWISGGGQTVLRNSDVPALKSYAVCSFDHDARVLIIERCTFAGGDRDSHTIRLQRIHAARIVDCTIEGIGARSALSIRDGADNRVEGCTINGRLYLGPLADGDGGINHSTATAADRARRDELLRRTQRNLLFRNCAIDTDGITVEMGVQNLVLDGCRIKTTRSWALRLNEDEYAPWRNVPSGRVVNCELTGPRGLTVFEHAKPAFFVANTTANGERVADTLPQTQPATRPGGATPGEVPTTTPGPGPTTLPAPSVLRFDLIDAKTGAVLRDVKDGDVITGELPASVNVVAMTNPAVVGSVRVTHNGAAARWENTRPYTVGHPALDLSVGSHVITATPFGGANGAGRAGAGLTIAFTRVAPATMPPTQPAPPVAEEVRREDVVAAIDHHNDALERLRGATQPSR